MATQLEQSADLAIGNEANAGGGEGSGAEPASPAPAKAAPVRDILSKVALALLAPKARSKPLSAQTDGFVLSTIGRLVDAHRDGVVSSGEAGADLRELLDEADRRAITKQLSVGTCTEAERIASIDDAVAPIEAEKSIDLQVEADVAEQMDPGEPFAGRVIEIAVMNVIPDPDQPRLEVDTELADSIKAQGVLQPIVVRRNPTPNDAPFILVDGERRWRAARAVELDVIPARVVTDVDDAGDRLLHQVVFNEGKRLAPMEEAKAWARIMSAKGWNIQQLATALGRAKSTVSDRLALLDAPKPFQELFMKAQLSAAAAPIVREYREVPERILKQAVKDLVDDEYEGWGQFISNGVPVPVDVVKQALENTVVPPSWGNDWLVPIDKGLGEKYSGPVATIKGKKYAADVDAYRALEQDNRPKASPNSTTPAKHEPDKWELERRAREKKERVARDKKMAERRAQYDAIVAKLPTSLNLGWALFVVRGLVGEMTQDTLRTACKLLEIEPPKQTQHSGYQFDKALLTHASLLRTPEALVQLTIKLLLAHDMFVSTNYDTGTKRLAAAAELAKLDLKKVKAPDSAEKKPAAKKAAKKGGRR